MIVNISCRHITSLLNSSIAYIISTSIYHGLAYLIHFCRFHFTQASHCDQSRTRNRHGKINNKINIFSTSKVFNYSMSCGLKFLKPDVLNCPGTEAWENLSPLFPMVLTIFSHHIFSHQPGHKAIRLP